MSPQPPAPPPAPQPSAWQKVLDGLSWLWSKRRSVVAGAALVLTVVCPVLPPQAQVVCHGVHALVRVGEQLLGPELEPCPDDECTSISGPQYSVHEEDGGDCGCPARQLPAPQPEPVP